jgi:hypothetical protein
MSAITILEQRKALAVQEALETVHEDLAELGLADGRLVETKNEPLLEPEYVLPILVAELARALGAEREARKALGRAFGELTERVEGLEEKR